MLKKQIYPKTERLKVDGEVVKITEKLDGSNLCIFKLNDKIYIAQRKNIFTYEELEETKDIMYTGLYQWLVENIDFLEKELYERSALCGEWLGMGTIKYNIGDFDKRFYMFAKANIDEDYNLYNIKYDHDLFIYPFISQNIPSFIGIVPLVAKIKYLPNKNDLDKMYNDYLEKVNREVEGFVVEYNNQITKYVRMKNGKLKEHFEHGKADMVEKIGEKK